MILSEYVLAYSLHLTFIVSQKCMFLKKSYKIAVYIINIDLKKPYAALHC